MNVVTLLDPEARQYADALAEIFARRIRDETFPVERPAIVLNVVARLEAEFVTGERAAEE